MSRFALKYHNPIDFSVLSCESEEIEHDEEQFMFGLERDMKSRDMDWLTKHYPEFEFHCHVGKKANVPKGDMRVRRSKGWLVATWRK
jgi:hypothetical protein